MKCNLETILKKLLLLILIVSFILSPLPSVLADDGDETEIVIEDTRDGVGSEENEEAGNGDAAEEGEEVPPAETGEESGETAEETEEEAAVSIPFGFPGMGEDYVMSDRQLAEKGTLAAYGLPGILDKATEGVDYAPGELMFNADSSEYVSLVAAAYNADIVSFSLGIAVIRLRANTVYEAMTVAADTTVPMPAVNPNYNTSLAPAPAPKQKMLMMAKSAAVSGTSSVPTHETWQSWYDSFEDKELVDRYLQDPGAGDNQYQWMHERINSFAAWSVTTGSSSVRVAVIDTGVDPHHEDFAGTADSRLPRGDDPVYGSFYVDEGSNVVCYCVSDLSDTQRCYVTQDNNSRGHGTHCAGILAAAMGNGLGGAGVAPGITVVSINAYSYNYTGGFWSFSYADQAKAINLAKETGCDIISMSLGGYYYNSAVDTAVQNAVAAGCTIIAAMGNDGSNIKAYPAAYNNVIAVGNIASNGKLASGSNYGAWCDICAPGEMIMSTVPGDEPRYEIKNGTSMATPVIAGAAALYMSKFGHVSPAVMENVLKAATNKCASSGSGAGIIDLSKLFSGDKTPPEIICLDRGMNSLDSYTAGVAADGFVSVRFSGDSEDGSRVIVYTTDGTVPSVMNGSVSNGTLLEHETAESGSFSIPLSTLGTVGSTVSIKAIAVNGVGVASPVTSATIKLIPTDAATDVSIVCPESISPNSKVTLKAYVLPEIAEQSVIWSVTAPDGVSIDKNGLLSVPAYVAGTITVKAVSSANPSVFSEVNITAAQISKVSAILSAPAAVSLGCQPGLKQGEKYELNPQFLLEDGSVYSLYKSSDPEATDVLKASFSSSNSRVATVNADGVICAAGKGSAIISCRALDGSGKSAAVKVTVKQYVETIGISGLSSIAPGRSAVYMADVKPLNAGSRKLEWSLKDAPPGVTLDAARRTVKVNPGVSSGSSFFIIARATDGSGAEAQFEVRIQPRITYLNARLQNASNVVNCTYTTAGTLKDVTLFSSAVQGLDRTRAEIKPEYGTAYDVDFSWRSSNLKVATVDGNGTVTAHKAGKAKIFCEANDGSGKKATFTVTVITPASSFNISPAIRTDTGKYTLAFGRSMSFNSSLGSAYGTPSKPTSQSWRFEIAGGYTRDVTGLHSYIKINPKNGRVTVSKKLLTLWSYYDNDFILRVYSTVTYGTGANSLTYTAQSEDIILTQGTSKVGVYCYYDAEKKEYEYPVTSDTAYVGLSNTYILYCDDLLYTWNFNVSSSNPDVCGCRQCYSGGKPAIAVYGVSPGKAVIRVKSMDGTGRSYSFVITVKALG